MPTVSEPAGKPIQSVLDLGIETLSLETVVSFYRYVRLVLPLDGFVFWVRASLVSPNAIFNASPMNKSAFNVGPRYSDISPAMSYDVTQKPSVLNAKGSIHYSLDASAEEEGSYSRNQVVFTSEVPVKNLEEIDPNELYIGDYDGLRFSFSRQGKFYEPAEIYHYVGTAITAVMQTQIIDDPIAFDSRSLVVSNSLPLWLMMNLGQPYLPWPPPAAPIQLFPSFLVPVNQAPPYGSVHIEPGSTEAIQAVPLIDQSMTHWQLVKEKVDITLFGLRNYNALGFVDYVYSASTFTDWFGIMNSPIVQDEKHPQVEINAIAMKKKVSFEINYYQGTIRNIARQLILSCIPTYVFSNLR